MLRRPESTFTFKRMNLVEIEKEKTDQNDWPQKTCEMGTDQSWIHPMIFCGMAPAKLKKITQQPLYVQTGSTTTWHHLLNTHNALTYFTHLLTSLYLLCLVLLPAVVRIHGSNHSKPHSDRFWLGCSWFFRQDYSICFQKKVYIYIYVLPKNTLQVTKTIGWSKSNTHYQNL